MIPFGKDANGLAQRPSTEARGPYPITSAERAFLFLCAGVCLIVLWLAPRALGDLYIALAAGRDILTMGIGLPDHWSFTTQGRIWINQSWAAHVLFYAVHRLAGEWGLLLLKLLSIAACVLFSALSAGRKKAPLAFACFFSAFIMSLLYHYIDLRPNLLSFVFVSCLLWLIYESRERPWVIGLAALLVSLWTHIHGSVVYGMGLLAAWFFFQALQQLIQTGKPDYLRLSLYGVALPAAFFLGVWTSPYGLELYRATFDVGGSRVWRSVAEWLPLWVPAPFGTAFPYILILLGFLSLLAATLAMQKKCTLNKGVRPPWRDDPRLAEKLFDAFVILVTACMAFSARRFIPLSVLVLLPIFCALSWKWIVHFKKDWVIPVLSVSCLFITVLLFVLFYLPWYTQGNRITNQGSLYERMHLVHANYPVGMTGFINMHGLSGNLFCEWRWEGFFRWHCPQIRIFTGGRAQQVYRENTLLTYQKIMAGQVPSADIASMNIQMVALSASSSNASLINLLIHDPGRWAPAYDDGRFVLFIKTPFLR